MTTGDLFQIRNVDMAELRRERERVQHLILTIIPGSSVMEVGATAVEGVIGKQDVDFVVRVPASQFAATRDALDAAFLRNKSQLSNQEYQAYTVPSEFDVSIQLIVVGGSYDVFEKFLNLLRASPNLRGAYNDLKRAWIGQPMDAYRKAKAAFIASALEQDTAPTAITPDRGHQR